MNRSHILRGRFNRTFFLQMGSKWVLAAILLFSACLLLRIYTAVRFSLLPHADISVWTSVFFGFGFLDVFFILRVLLFSIVPFFLLSLLSVRVAHITFTGFTYIYSFLYLCLVEYFAITKLPLDHVVMEYSPAELVGIVRWSTSFSQTFWIFWVGFVVVTMALTAIYFLFSKIKISQWPIWVLLSASILVAPYPYKSMLYNEAVHSSMRGYYLSLNQFSYTLHKIIDYNKAFSQKLTAQEVEDATARFRQLFPECSYANPQYPFLRRSDDADVLGPFFRPTSNGLPPNIVVVVIESWGKELSGVVNPVLSFTPFLDSLASVGLHWKNCLATTERTFGVLPSLFASAPYGDRGFANSYVPIPEHRSLFLDLKQNGYHSAFFYGGNASFDGQDRFLYSNGIDYIMSADKDNLNPKNKQLLIDNNRWGVDDKEMFAVAQTYLKQQPEQAPYIHVYQTLTTHEPFVFEELDVYVEKVKALFKAHAKELESQPVEMELVKANMDVYAAYLYMDDCIRNLVAYYRSQKDFENTIFVFTGDHRIGGLMNNNPLQVYHVPLTIYSPLLNEARTMDAVVSHADITPSLNAYLSHNYQYTIDDKCAWLGESLDTTTAFVCKKRMAFMRNNRDIVEWLHGDKLLVGRRLYKVERDLQTNLIDDKKCYEQMCQELNDFKIVNHYAVKNDLLWLEELANKKLLCHYQFDFDEVVPEYYHEIIRAARDGNHYAIADEQHPYLPLMLPFTLQENGEKMFLEFSFDVKLSKKILSALPEIMVHISDGEGDDFYQEYDFRVLVDEPISTKKSMHCYLKTTLYLKDKCLKGKTMKAVLWSKKGALVELDNLDTRIEIQN
ncbi:MAG: sulfatase-like hydrolase/transferase [Bacteroidales bacterium]|nr:sulfatase-like hydrolase/transferase [Bacteroidales bacterium]